MKRLQHYYQCLAAKLFPPIVMVLLTRKQNHIHNFIVVACLFTNLRKKYTEQLGLSQLKVTPK